MSKLTTSQRFAVGQTLSDHDPHLTYQEIQDAMFEAYDDPDMDDRFTIWEPFENMDPTTLCDTMDDLEFAFRQYASQVTRKLRDAIRDGDTQSIANQLEALENELKPT